MPPLTEKDLREKIARNYDRPDPTAGFLMLYRELVISIGDGDILDDPKRLCRVLAAGEVRHSMGDPPKMA